MKTTPFTTKKPTKTPSQYTQAELDAGADGLWLCGRSEDQSVINSPFKCGGACPVKRRRRGILSFEQFSLLFLKVKDRVYYHGNTAT